MFTEIHPGSCQFNAVKYRNCICENVFFSRFFRYKQTLNTNFENGFIIITFINMDVL